jgi:tetratricopeptide (TPR) repeat protein
MGLYRIAGLLLLCIPSQAQPTSPWKLTRSDHFELYSQSDDAAARSALLWFEQLRAFYLQKTGLAPEALHPVRVIGFRSARDYQPYQLHMAADAHYIGTDARDYIVLSEFDTAQLGTAAHEYAHAVLHAAGLQFPPWLSEGLAEFFSTVRINQRECTLGGDLPARSQALQRRTWMPLEDLLAMPANSPLRDNRETAAIFYSQSWALVDMLILSPEYGPKFSDLTSALSSDTPNPAALPRIYGKSLSAVTSDLRLWTASKHQPVPLSGIQPNAVPPQDGTASVDVSPLQARVLMADMLLAAGELDRAGAIYSDLARETPRDPAMPAALGNIALRQGDHARAREQWQLAIALGIQDATLCYQYALLGDRAGVPDDQLRPALERAIQLKPDFDDARYALALMEKNAGHYDTAVAQLRAMRNVAPARAYNYWLAMADALVQSDHRAEARLASQKAAEHATTEAERARAAKLAHFADTDLAVQFTMGKNGRAELATTRVPHATGDFNPFIEPSDKIRHVEGNLRQIDCSGPVTRFIVNTPDGPVTLAIPDPGHVQMRNAPTEFTCGPQQPTQVVVDYAESVSSGSKAEGVARGILFR